MAGPDQNELHEFTITWADAEAHAVAAANAFLMQQSPHEFVLTQRLLFRRILKMPQRRRPFRRKLLLELPCPRGELLNYWKFCNKH